MEGLLKPQDKQQQQHGNPLQRPRSGGEGSGPGRAGDGMPRDGEGDVTDSMTLEQLRAQTAAMAKQRVSLRRGGSELTDRRSCSTTAMTIPTR